MRTALREAKESKTCLVKIRHGELANATQVAALGLEQEADELCAFFSSIITNMSLRLGAESQRRRRRKLKTAN